MKLVMDETLKHRIIGIAVIISLGAIFAPAVMRKSSQHLESTLSVSVKLPPKPSDPDVAEKDEKDLFKTIKIERVKIPPVATDKQLPDMVKAESIKSNRVLASNNSQLASIEPEIKVASVKTASTGLSNKAEKAGVPVRIKHDAPVQPIEIKQLAHKSTPPKVVAQNKPIKALPKIAAKQVAKTKPTTQLKKEIYAVQLASFSQMNNAQSLINRLKAKGYSAKMTKDHGSKGSIYKVYVGHSPIKNDVIKLKSQLASAMQLNGFVVNTGVS